MKKRSFYDEINNNKRDSIILMIVVFSSVLFIGWFIGWFYDPSIASVFVILAAFLAIFMSWYGYYHSDRIVLSTINGFSASPVKYRRLHSIIDGLCIAGGLPKPRVYVIRSSDINAFATGRDPEHALVGVTQGAVDKLSRDELEGVLAHELSHVRNYDTRFMTLVASLVGVVVIISELFSRSLWFGGGRSRDDDNRSGLLVIFGLLFALLAPFFVKLIQLAVSRKREFLADSSAVELTRNPDGLASALLKIKSNSNRLRVSKAVNHLFIADTFSNRLSGLFSTHPSIDERVKRLRSM